MLNGSFFADLAWLPDGLGRRVLIDVAAGRITAITTDAVAPHGATRLTGLTIPGLANAHSHAFHRALRGRTHTGKGTFWTWRERMYAIAARLDPDTYYTLALATYAEMALAGVTCVGEFHYVHRTSEGGAYAEPNAMGEALLAAAGEAGIRITLLDTLYLTATVDGGPLEGSQRRFSDGNVDGWSERHAALRPREGARVGAALHSVRAVPADVLSTFVARNEGAPLHIHLSEQRTENLACRARYGCSPTELLDAHGVLGPQTTAVHATHLSDLDRTLLGDRDTGVCFCPTTERDLADGIGPARALVDAGCALSLGSDSNAVIDLFEEARGVELDERLRSEQRGHFSAAELLDAATRAGHAALGWPDTGAIAPGQRADLVAVRLDTVRTAGVSPAAVVFAATAADVSTVVRDGQVIVRDGVHATVPDAPQALADAIEVLW